VSPTLPDHLQRGLRAERAFAAEATHRLRNPLTGLRVRLEDVTGWQGVSAQVRTELRRALAQVDRVDEELTRLLEERTARLTAQASANVHCELCVVAQRWARRLAPSRRRVVVDGPEDVEVALPSRELARILDVLVAAGAARGRGDVHVATHVSEAHVGILVRVDDDVAAGRLAGAVEAGLALAEDLVETFGGRWGRSPRTPHGTEILLPRSRPGTSAHTFRA
jgi:signal transduction histidine kinase